jgi:hypothetical protein
VPHNITHQTGLVLKNGVVSVSFVSKREEIMGDRRKMNDDGTNQVTFTARHYSDRFMGYVTIVGKLQ